MKVNTQNAICIMYCDHIHKSKVLHMKHNMKYVIANLAAPEVNISSLTLANRSATTLSVTWSAGYPKCYSFTVSHSTQDGSINDTQPADSDTSHTLTSLQPGTTYRTEVEAVRKGEGADGQRAMVTGNFTTGKGEAIWTVTLSCIFTSMHLEINREIVNLICVGQFLITDTY